MSDAQTRKTLPAELQAQIISMASWRPQSIADRLGVSLAQVQEVLARVQRKGGRR